MNGAPLRAFAGLEAAVQAAKVARELKAEAVLTYDTACALMRSQA
jgi:hypothetical protein